MASICCSPPDSVPAAWWRRSARIGKRSNSRVHVGGDAGRVGAQVAAHLQVLVHRHVGKDAPALGTMGDAELQDALGRGARDVFAQEGDAARRRRQHARDRLERGRLAGAVGADQR